MYVGTYYNSYYNSLFGSTNSVFGQIGKTDRNALSSAAASVYNQSAFGSDALKYVQNIKSSSAALGNSLKSLSSGGAFRQQSAVSSDTASVAVKDSGSVYRTGTMASSVSVERVATAQANEGKALQSRDSAGLSGYQQFAIEVGGRVRQFSFEVNDSDSNETIQGKMAQAINSAGIGITATIAAEGGTSKLTLESAKTGLEQGQFEIRDVAGSAAQDMGVTGVTRQAQDAAYRLNSDELKTSATNTVDIGGGVSATFIKPTADTVSITRGVDSSYAIEQAEKMVESYNALYSEALQNTSDSRANNLFSKLVGISRTYASSLAGVGIGFDSNGYMAVDKNKMESAVQSGKLQSFFEDGAGKSYGFASQLSRAADDVQQNTNRYVSPSSFMQGKGSSGLSSIFGDSASSLLSSLAGSGNTGWMLDLLL